MPKSWWPWSRRRNESSLLYENPITDEDRLKKNMDIREYVAHFNKLLKEAEDLSKKNPVEGKKMKAEIIASMRYNKGGRKRSRARRARKTIRF